MTDKIPYTDFSKLDLRVGQIVKAEDHPNADKLLVLIVDLNEDEDRVIVAGLKGHYEKEELEGKKAIFVTNLEPSKIRGIESNGMILAASDKEGRVIILSPEKDIEIGSKVK